MALTFSTGMQYMQLATPATTDAATQNTKHQFVNLVKQFFTCFQQQSKGPRWKPGFFQQSGWARTPQQVRTTRLSRQVKPGKYNGQMLDVINSTPMTAPSVPSFVPLPTRPSAAARGPQATAETCRNAICQMVSAPHLTAQPAFSQVAVQPAHYRLTHGDSTINTAALPTPTVSPTSERAVEDDSTEGSSARLSRTTTQQTAASRPETTHEPPATRQRISMVEATAKKGQKIKAASNEDEFLGQRTSNQMEEEIRSLKNPQVYTEVTYSSLTPEQPSNIMESRWVLRHKGNSVRARVVAKGYTEDVKGNGDIYASARIFCALRLLLAMAMVYNWIVRNGDISTAYCFHPSIVDDLLFLGKQATANELFQDIQQHLLPRPREDLTVGNTVIFLGRNIPNKGDFYEASRADDYIAELLTEANILGCNAAPAPGTKATSSRWEQSFAEAEPAAYRRAVSKLQWTTYTRPDLLNFHTRMGKVFDRTNSCRPAKVQAPTKIHQKNTAPHIRPKAKATDTIPDITVHVDSSWAAWARQ